MREQLIQYVELLFAGGRDCEDIKQEILQNTLDRYDDLIAEGKVPEAAYRLAITGIGDINEILGTKPQTAAPVYTAAPPASPLPADNDTTAKKIMRAVAVGLYILCPMPLIVLSEMGMDIIGLCGTLSIVAVATVLIILGAKKRYKNGTSPFVEDDEDEESLHKTPLQKSLSSIVWSVGVAVYFLISFSFGKWHITWVIFPILAALDRFLCVLVENKDYNTSLPADSAGTRLRKELGTVITVLGLALYFVISFATQAWYATWLILIIAMAVKGLVNAILDYKEAEKHET